MYENKHTGSIVFARYGICVSLHSTATLTPGQPLLIGTVTAATSDMRGMRDAREPLKKRTHRGTRTEGQIFWPIDGHRRSQSRRIVPAILQDNHLCLGNLSCPAFVGPIFTLAQGLSLLPADKVLDHIIQ